MNAKGLRIPASTYHLQFNDGNGLYVHGEPEWATCDNQNKAFAQPSWYPKKIAVYLSWQDYIPASESIADHVHPTQPLTDMRSANWC